jgi:hypothetical protein
MSQWVQHVNVIYPGGWLESGGPVRTSRSAHGTRHIPNGTGFGGYDLCGEVRLQAIACRHERRRCGMVTGLSV